MRVWGIWSVGEGGGAEGGQVQSAGQLGGGAKQESGGIDGLEALHSPSG